MEQSSNTKILHKQKNVKMKTLKSRRGDAQIDVAKVQATPLKAQL